MAGRLVMTVLGGMVLRVFSGTEASGRSCGLLTCSDMGGVLGLGFLDTDALGDVGVVEGIGEFLFPVSGFGIHSLLLPFCGGR